MDNLTVAPNVVRRIVDVHDVMPVHAILLENYSSPITINA
jgi:hypothetical protein